MGSAPIAPIAALAIAISCSTVPPPTPMAPTCTPPKRIGRPPPRLVNKFPDAKGQAILNFGFWILDLIIKSRLQLFAVLAVRLLHVLKE